MVCRLVAREDWRRAGVERYVQEVYQRAHGAVIRRFPDVMVAEFDDAGAVRGGAGLRLATDGFFSECYVDRAFEELLSELALERVGRERIIEVSGLAAAGLRPLVRMIVEIIAFARRIGIDWAVFTVTARLRELLSRMNLPIVVLCPAEASRVANIEDWGRYYETRPVVAVMRDTAAPGTMLRLPRASGRVITPLALPATLGLA